MERDISRRSALMLISLGSAGLLSGDVSTNSPRESHPYPRNPDRPILDSRPVRIYVDPRERELSGRTFSLPSESIPPQTTILTPEIEAAGFVEYLDGTFQPAAQIPPDNMQPIYDALFPLDAMRFDTMSIPISVFAVKQYQQEKGVILSGLADHATNRISLEFVPDLELPLERVQMNAFHERVHMWEDEVRFPDSYTTLHRTLLNDAEDLVDAYKTKVKNKDYSEDESPRLSGAPSDNTPSLKALGPLVNIISESSYLEPQFKDVGHPLANIKELFASTITVARYFPNSLIASINALEKEEDRELIRTTIRESIQILRDYADEPGKADAIFVPQLLDFINQ